MADGVGSDYDPPEEVLGISDANGSGPAGADGAGATASRAQPGAH